MTPRVIAALQREVYDELKREGYPLPSDSGVERGHRRTAVETETVDDHTEPAVGDGVARLTEPDSAGSGDAAELTSDAA
ncbi:hypothetical protein [Actinokineospora alba]|uniref:hypothetical protein n=1 Tax=Actinokineospora alba TaxID=504798 RepID=UPI00105C45B3|nr:hypothetical protein [Actinokineospora alba]